MTRKTIVRHEDGTVSTRTSKSRFYAFAVVLAESAAVLATQARDMAVKAHKEAERYAKVTAASEFVTREKPWSGGRSYFDVYAVVDGERVWLDGNPDEAPSMEECLEAAAKFAAQYAERADHFADKARTLEEGPETIYGVLRWSSREDLAQKAASGEFGIYAERGHKVYVVPCEEA